MLDSNTLLIKESIIKQVLSLSDINHIVDATFKDFGHNCVINPTKVTLDLGETGAYPYYEGFMNAMPAYVGSRDIAGLKWVGGFQGARKAAHLPYITAMILLINPHLGTFLSVMEGAYISNMRTGAQAALSIEYLLRRPTVTIGLYGAGMQARTTIMAISDRMDIETLYVWNHRRSTAEQFKKEMTPYVKGRIEVVDDPQAPTQAQVLITLTPAQEPLIQTEWVQPGTIVMPMGSFQEIEDSLILKADQIIVDHVDQALHRGALKHLTHEDKLNEESISMTIGELALQENGLEAIAQQIILCIPIGTGAMDVAVAHAAYEKVRDMGLGHPFNFLA